MGKPAKMPLDIYRGDSEHWSVELFTDEAATEPFDLAGCTVKAEIRQLSGKPLLAELDLTVTLPNRISMDLTPEASHNITEPKCMWDMQVTDAAGRIRTIIAGLVTVTLDITDSANAG